MNAIVDIQGFKTENNEFIVKEIAILYKNKTQVFLIKPPFPFHELTKWEKKQVNWIERNRNIYWSEGSVPYSKCKGLITNILKDKCLYAKGLEKVAWLKYILKNNNIVNLEDKGCPNLLSLYNLYKYSGDVYSCNYHDSVCALKNVLSLNKWLYNNNKYNN